MSELDDSQRPPRLGLVNAWHMCHHVIPLNPGRHYSPLGTNGLSLEGSGSVRALTWGSALNSCPGLSLLSKSFHSHDTFSVDHWKPQRLPAWNRTKTSWGTGVRMLSFRHLFCYLVGILVGLLLHLSESDFSHLNEISKGCYQVYR